MRQQSRITEDQCTYHHTKDISTAMWNLSVELACPPSRRALQELPKETKGLKLAWMKPEDLPLLADFPALQYLDLKGAQISGKQLLQMPVLPALTHLALPHDQEVYVPALQHISQFPQLAHLDLGFVRGMDDAALVALATSHRWQSLNLSGTSALTDAEGGKIVRSDVFVAGVQNTIGTWDWKTKTKGTSSQGSSPATALILSPDGRWMAAARRKIEVTDLVSGEEHNIPVGKNVICAMTFSHDNKHLWAADGSTLRHWTTEGWHPRSAPAVPAHALFCIPGGKHMYAALKTGELLTLDVQEGTELERTYMLDQPMVYLTVQTGQGHIVEDIAPSKQRSLPTGWSVQTIAIDTEGDLIILAAPTVDGERHWGGGHMLCCPGVNYRYNADPGSAERAAISSDGQYLALAGHDSPPDFAYWTRMWPIAQIRRRFPTSTA